MSHPHRIICALGLVVLSFWQLLGQAEKARAQEKPRVVVRKLASLSAHPRSAASVTFSPDGQLLASASIDQTVKLWTLEDRRLRGTLSGFAPGPEGTWDREAVFSPDGKVLVTVVSSKSVRGWDWKTRKQLWSKPVGARSVAFAPDGKTFVTADWEDINVRVWNTQDGKLLSTLAGLEGKLRPGCWSQGTVAYAPDGKTFASTVGGADKGMRLATRLTIWDAATRTPRFQVNIQPGRIHALTYSPDSKHLAMGGVGGTIRLLALPGPVPAPPDPDKVKRLIAQLDDDAFIVRQAAQEALLEIGPGVEPQLRRALATTKAQEVRFRIRAILATFAKRYLASPRILQEHQGTVMGLAFSPKGQLLASCSREFRRGRGRIVLWDLADSKRPLFRWEGPGVTSVSFSPDGQRLAASGQDGSITLWEIVPTAPNK